MANVIVVKNMATALEDHDPYIWKCSACGKEKKYTQEEIDKKKKPWSDPQNHDMDYYVTCPFCKKGEMEPPTFVSYSGAFEKMNKK
jgi:translation initiation factor 2 beta subunit (eIF-2beta)/eIF-5